MLFLLLLGLTVMICALLLDIKNIIKVKKRFRNTIKDKVRMVFCYINTGFDIILIVLFIKFLLRVNIGE